MSGTATKKPNMSAVTPVKAKTAPPKSKDERTQTYKYTPKERDEIEKIGEFLTKNGVSGLKTGGRGINVSAVIRHLIDNALNMIHRPEGVIVADQLSPVLMSQLEATIVKGVTQAIRGAKPAGVSNERPTPSTPERQVPLAPPPPTMGDNPQTRKRVDPDSPAAAAAARLKRAAVTINRFILSETPEGKWRVTPMVGGTPLLFDSYGDAEAYAKNPTR